MNTIEVFETGKVVQVPGSWREMTPDQVRSIKYESTKRMANVFINRVLSDYQALVKTGVFGNVDELDSEYDLNTDNVIKKYEKLFKNI